MEDYSFFPSVGPNRPEISAFLSSTSLAAHQMRARWRLAFYWSLAAFIHRTLLGQLRLEFAALIIRKEKRIDKVGVTGEFLLLIYRPLAK
jgi:hypothetical protein